MTGVYLLFQIIFYFKFEGIMTCIKNNLIQREVMSLKKSLSQLPALTDVIILDGSRNKAT